MPRLSPAAVIIAAGAVTLSLSFGARSIFGIVLDPISAEFGWPREVFSLSIAIQNMVWGLAQPFFGMIADRFGDRRAPRRKSCRSSKRDRARRSTRT